MEEGRRDHLNEFCPRLDAKWHGSPLAIARGFEVTRFAGHRHRRGAAVVREDLEVLSSSLGGLTRIVSGGRRSLATATAAAALALEHRRFQQALVEAPERDQAALCRAHFASVGRQFRDLVLENGGFQIKVGQMVSMQKAVLPAEITEALAPCCVAARTVDFSDLEPLIVARLGLSALEDSFEQVERTALASASVAQVHRCRLKKDGTVVVLKVQHAGVADLMRADVAFLPYLAAMVSYVEPDHGLDAFQSLVNDMLAQEVDFRIEAHNRERLAAVVDRSGRSQRSQRCDVRFPRVHWEFAREGVMVQDFEHGKTLADIHRENHTFFNTNKNKKHRTLHRDNDDDDDAPPFALAVEELAAVFAECVFVHGYTHNDLHPGNVLVRKSAAPSSKEKKKLLSSFSSACFKRRLRRHARRCSNALVAAFYAAVGLGLLALALVAFQVFNYAALGLLCLRRAAFCMIVPHRKNIVRSQIAAAAARHAVSALEALVDDPMVSMVAALLAMAILTSAMTAAPPSASASSSSNKYNKTSSSSSATSSSLRNKKAMAPGLSRFDVAKTGAASLVVGAASRLSGLQGTVRRRCDAFVAEALGARFDLILIDHGFHTDLPEEIRLAFCQAWAGVGLRDSALLASAAATLGLTAADVELVPLLLCLLPYDDWRRGRFPGPAATAAALRDPDRGLRRCAAVAKKLPKPVHLILRANRQLFALFQMQFGLSPTTRLEFMRCMTTNAMLGLRFKRPDTTPDPDDLTTADKAFFDANITAVRGELRSRFIWAFPKLVDTSRDANEIFTRAQQIFAKQRAANNNNNNNNNDTATKPSPPENKEGSPTYLHHHGAPSRWFHF